MQMAEKSAICIPPTHDEEGLWHYGVKNEINYIKDIGNAETTFYELTPILALQL